MPTTSNPTSTITLADIENAVNTNLSSLVHGQSYTLEQLVGSTFWNSIPTPARPNLGHAFRAKAGRDELPVIYIDRTTSNKALYEPK